MSHPPTDPTTLAAALLDTAGEFRIAHSNWYLDARFPRSRAIVSHAHADHIGRHATVLAHPITCDLLSHRLATPEESPTLPLLDGELADAAERVPTQLLPLPYNTPHLDPLTGFTIDLFPAGHVLGSAMPRVTTPRGRLLYTGDFRFCQPHNCPSTHPTCQLPPDGADVVLMECTYGLPRYKFPPRSQIIEQLCDLLTAAFAEGKQPICLCYSLGKAQEVARILADNGFALSMHGAAHAITSIYHQHNVRVADARPYAAGQIEGTVLIAPPHIRNSRMITNIKNAAIFVITGWALDSAAKYRYQAKHALPLSDHADFDELNAFVDAMRDRGAKHFLLTHGFVKEFTRHLRSRNISAAPAHPPKQMSLFDD
jgi:Cft2 family RNA processing exonuclease